MFSQAVLFEQHKYSCVNQISISEPTVVEAIVSRVAARDGVAETDLPPMAHTVDTDALVALLDSAEHSLVVSFRYHGHDVTVDETGTVTVD